MRAPCWGAQSNGASAAQPSRGKSSSPYGHLRILTPWLAAELEPQTHGSQHGEHWVGARLSQLLLTCATLTRLHPLCSRYRQANVSVNLYVVNEPWLFSVLWCAGVGSVTTNACQVLKEMKRPLWLLVSEPTLGGAGRGLHARARLARLHCHTPARGPGPVLPGLWSPLNCSSCLVALQPRSTYLMVWIVTDCVSFLLILSAFLLLQ